MSYYQHATRFTPNVEMPMRDGAILRANMYQPVEDGKYPVLLTRTPYNKDLSTNGVVAAQRFASNGYVVLVQDCRGRFASDGVFSPLRHEMEDGYDSVEWAARLPCSSGRVGVFGPSYLGATTWLAAASQPPHLAAIAPAVTGCDYHDGWFYQSGAFLLGFSLNWAVSTLGLPNVARLAIPEPEKTRLREALLDIADHPSRAVMRQPLAEVAELLAKSGAAPYYRDWLTHPDDDEYWQRWSIARHHQRITVPALAFGGWYDMFLHGTLQNFTGMRAQGGSEAARRHQRLIIGPWAHTVPLYGPNQGEVFFGVGAQGAAMDTDGLVLRWFDHWLRGVDNGVDREPAVRYFTMGANRWEAADDWPVPGTDLVSYYLHSGGWANGAAGDGLLSPEAPGDEPPDVFVYDPRKPVPTRGGGASGRGGAYDQRPLETRQDVLVYTSPPLARDLKVTGPVMVEIWAASTARDTDFSAKLVDVSPDGFALNLADNLVRARYRKSLARPELLKPGEVTRYAIDLYGTSNLFQAGHRVRIEVSSSNFPRFDRNPNTGTTIATETEMVAALQTVFHDSRRASCVRLPVVRS